MIITDMISVICHAIKSLFPRGFFYRIRSGKTTALVHFILFQKRAIFRAIRRCWDVSNIRPLSWKTWKAAGNLWTGHFYRLRFMANSKEYGQVFIKIGVSDCPTKNEALFCERILKRVYVSHGIRHLPFPVKCRSESKYIIVIYRFIPGFKSLNETFANPTIDYHQHLDQINSALHELEKLALVHCDLNGTNMGFDENGVFYFVDFGAIRVNGVNVAV